MILEQTGSWQSEAFDVNNAGQIVGYSENALGYEHATLWTIEEYGVRQVDLGTLVHFENSNAEAINELGQIIGYCWGSGAKYPYAVAWTEPVGMVALIHGELEPTHIEALNNLGLAVGTSGVLEGSRHACVWQLPMPPLTPEERWRSSWKTSSRW